GSTQGASLLLGWRHRVLPAGLRSTRVLSLRFSIEDGHTGRSIVIFDIGEALILVWCTLQRPAFICRLPLDDILYLLRQLEVLIGNYLGSVILQTHFDPGVGCGDIRMMPCRFGKMTNGVDHHERAFPAVGAVLAADPTILEIPMWQVAF